MAGLRVGGGERCEAVVAGRGVEPFDAGQLGQPASVRVADQHGDQVDRLGDQRARDRHDGLLDELLHPAERTERGAGVNRADAAGVAGAPGFDEVERLGAANLADGDTIGPEAQRRADQLGQRHHAVLGPHGDEVGRGALQLSRVFDQNDAIGSLGDFCQQRVDQRGLARARAARDEDVGAALDAVAQRLGFRRRHDAGLRVVVEREYGDGGLSDCEGRCGDDGRQQPLEPLAPFRQLGRDARGAGVNLDADMMRDQADDALAIGSAQQFARVADTFAEPIEPKPAVRVQHHFYDGGIVQPSSDRRPERGAQHPCAA